MDVSSAKPNSRGRAFGWPPVSRKRIHTEEMNFLGMGGIGSRRSHPRAMVLLRLYAGTITKSNFSDGTGIQPAFECNDDAVLVSYCLRYPSLPKFHRCGT
jgi:hypothetical protein